MSRASLLSGLLLACAACAVLASAPASAQTQPCLTVLDACQVCVLRTGQIDIRSCGAHKAPIDQDGMIPAELLEKPRTDDLDGLQKVIAERILSHWDVLHAVFGDPNRIYLPREAYGLASQYPGATATSPLDCSGPALGVRIVPAWRGQWADGQDLGPVQWEAGLLQPCHVIVQVASLFDQILPINLPEARMVTFRSLVSLPLLIKVKGGTIKGRESVTLHPGESITLYFVPGSGVWRIIDRYPEGRIFADDFESGNSSAWSAASVRLSIGFHRD